MPVLHSISIIKQGLYTYINQLLRSVYIFLEDLFILRHHIYELYFLRRRNSKIIFASNKFFENAYVMLSLYIPMDIRIMKHHSIVTQNNWYICRILSPL